MKNCFWTMLLASCMVMVGCGGDSGTNAKDDDSSSSFVKSSDSAKSSSSVDQSSAKSSSSVVLVIDPSTVVKGTMTDSRDGQTYKTVTIGSQTWMAENLNYAYTGVKYIRENDEETYTSDSTSWCYNNVADSCAKYGRLYTWAAAIDSVALANDADDPQTCGYTKECDRLTKEVLAEKSIQGVCPSGWHLPSNEEWEILIAAVGGKDVAATKLKSTDGWRDDGNGTDSYGFSALPAGYNYDGSNYSIASVYANFWTASQGPIFSTYAYSLLLTYDYEYASLGGFREYYGYSVRCVKD